jgi:U3 small nucleolar RNA-associated protein 22
VRRVAEDEVSEPSKSDLSEAEALDDSESLSEGHDGEENGEEGEWGGIGVTASVAEENLEAGNVKRNKPPTGEELRDIKEAADLFKSNSFKLQVIVLYCRYICGINIFSR